MPEQGNAAPATGDATGATPAQAAPEGGTAADPATTTTTTTPPATGDGPLGAPGLAALEAERTARRDADRRAQAAERELAKIRQAGMSDLEKAQARAAELERELADERTASQERELRIAAVEAATAIGFRNPAHAYRLLDRAAVDYDADGRPTNIEKLLRDLAKSDGYLLRSGGQPDFGGGDRGPAPSDKPDMNALLRAGFRGR